jgi:pimeloyl-ACP methyl ester carboxylesterase
MNNKFMTIDGLKIRYIDEGKGRPIVLLHGGSIGSSVESFKYVIPGLLEAGYRVLGFDQPGCGLSDIPEEDEKATREYREFIATEFVQALDLKDVVLVGHSQSGGIVGKLLLKKPEFCTAAVFLCAGICLPHSERFKPGNHKKDKHENFSTEPTVEDIRTFFEYNLYNHDLITEEVLNDRLKYSVGDLYNFFVKHRSMPKNTDYYLWAKFIEVDIPMMFVYGGSDDKRDDATVRVEKMRAIYPYPHFSIHLFDNCKHYPHWDHPKLTVDKVIEFLNKEKEIQCLDSETQIQTKNQ